MRTFARVVGLLALGGVLGVGCKDSKPPVQPVLYTVAGNVSGLSGTGLVLQLSGGETIPVTTNGAFAFTTELEDGAPYAVSVSVQPTGPVQDCQVANGMGTIVGADVSDVSIACTTSTFTVGGTVSGLLGSGLVLQLNGGDDINVMADGAFMFPPIDDGSSYTVSVFTSPTGPAQSCAISNGDATLAGSNITNVIVVCSTDAFTVAVNVSGLTGTGLTLQNRGTDDLAVSADGAITFGTPVLDLTPYGVTVSQHPTDQYCWVRDGAGTIAGANVSGLQVDCVSRFAQLANLSTRPIGSFPSDFITVNGTTVFIAQRADLGAELFVSDGTAVGTSLLVDTAPSADTFPRPEIGMVASNGELLFRGANNSLWRTPDASTATDTGFILAQGDMAEVGGEVYFSGFTGGSIDGSELNKLNLGTGVISEVLDIRTPGSGNPQHLIAFAGEVFFSADDGTTGRELWRSDGTDVGTVPVADIWSGGFDSFPQELTVMGAELFFSASDGINSGRQLWKTDGTTTVMVPMGGDAVNPVDLVDIGGTLFFIALTSGGDRVVHTSDGTTMNTGPVGSGYAAAKTLVAVGSLAYFTAEDAAGGNRELWVTDGTDMGTSQVADINSGAGSAFNASVFVRDQMVAFDGQLFFAADDGTSGLELWTANSTGTSASLVADIFPGPTGSFPANFGVSDSTLYFAADDPSTGYELWGLTSASGTPQLVADVDPGDLGSGAFGFAVAGDTFMFRASGDGVGNEPWFSDFTSQGTAVLDFDPGTGGSSSTDFVAFGDQFLFTLRESSDTLYSSDGTVGGSTMLTTLNNGQNYTVAGTQVFFSADDGVVGDELWVTDGTPGGTGPLKDINVGPDSSDPRDFASGGGLVMFIAYEEETEEEHYISDGTEAGTFILGDIAADTESSAQDEIVFLNGSFIFAADDQITGSELWITDGTVGGTQLLVDINTDPGSGSFPGSLAVAGNLIFFVADDGTHGREPWVSDGTPGGTMMLTDINTSGTSSPGGFTAVGNLAFFRADDGSTGQELWVSDGTPGGTQALGEIMTGPNGASITRMTPAGGKLVFLADDGMPSPSGNDLWVSDGTPSGTNKVRDVVTGVPMFADIAGLTSAGPALLFRGNDGSTGEEAWVYYP